EDKLQAVNSIDIDKKIVKLTSLNLGNTSSYGTILKSKDYTHAYNHKLENSLKEKTDKKSIGALTFSHDSCQEIIDKEQITYLEKEQAHIIVSIPYVYNIKKDSETKELEVTLYEENATASYMPELIVEYGVFFDGTQNNIYNINFYKNYTEFLKEPAEFIEENKGRDLERKTDIKLYDSIQEYIVSEANPELNNQVLILLLSQIDKAPNEIRYFDKNSNLETEEKELLKSTKAKHAKKVFEYFLEVKKELNTSEEENRERYIRENILADDDEDSSFTNGESNISRLYNLYDGADVKRDKTILPTSRFKLYESGAGTNNPFIQEDYEEDSGLFGSGLGGEKYLTKDKTGIEAHIIYACIKISEQLRASSLGYINELYLDIFGFSRGAATARHFICSILNEAEKNDKNYSIKMKKEKNIFTPFFGDTGIVSIDRKRYYNPLNTEKRYYGGGRSRIKNPYYGKKKITVESINFRFAGLYDTVPHFGLKQANDYENLNLNFFLDGNDEKIGQVVHLMAKDEFRYNFDAYSIFQDINKDIQKTDGLTLSGGKKFEEYFLPGAHSDVGGGYNNSSETTLLTKKYVKDYTEIPEYIRDSIIAWNNKYNWLNKNKIEKVKSKKEIKDDLEDGFYYCILPESIPSYFGTAIPKPMLYLYMHKKEVLNNYEYITLKIMYERAIYKDMTEGKDLGKKEKLEMVPFASLSSYSFKDDEILNKVYDTLEEKGEFISGDSLYKKLKDDYIHHSSKYADFINKASFEDKEFGDFYGKRVIYTALGDKFTLSE
ncbi:phospholipase effector Tle1 domain-containing protein, partial [Arcobacter sp.]|uniref:phospholipase effector Tle1 domain-containing protein n=1 Tax=Arcobacter sp. TaxID=1872629 RepID=UPI003C7095FE